MRHGDSDPKQQSYIEWTCKCSVESSVDYHYVIRSCITVSALCAFCIFHNRKQSSGNSKCVICEQRQKPGYTFHPRRNSHLSLLRGTAIENVCPLCQVSEQDALTIPSGQRVLYPGHACCLVLSGNFALRSLCELNVSDPRPGMSNIQSRNQDWY